MKEPIAINPKNVVLGWAEETAKTVKGRVIYTCSDHGVILMAQHSLHAPESRQCFTVIYGKQVNFGLHYTAACVKLGEAIMHSLVCDGLIN